MWISLELSSLIEMYTSFSVLCTRKMFLQSSGNFVCRQIFLISRLQWNFCHEITIKGLLGFRVWRAWPNESRSCWMVCSNLSTYRRTATKETVKVFTKSNKPKNSVCKLAKPQGIDVLSDLEPLAKHLQAWFDFWVNLLKFEHNNIHLIQILRFSPLQSKAPT